MRVITILILFSLSLSAVNIKFSKPFEQELKPNLLQAQISITVIQSSEKKVSGLLGKFSSFINDQTEIEKKGGNYNIYPQYNYENNQRYKSDYIGTINYNISSPFSEKLNLFLASLYEKKSDNRTSINTNSLRWIMSKEIKEGKVDKLRLDAILWSDIYAKELSTTLSKVCEVVKISFGNIDNFFSSEMTDIATSSAPIPTQDLQKITINPTFELECK